MRRSMGWLFALSCVALPLREAAAQSLQMADGKVLLAAVEEATGDGLRVRRLDNGGVLELRWDHLAPNSAMAIKKQFDLLAVAEQELMERAEEVEYLLGGSRQTLIGRIVEHGEKELVVQQKGVQFRIPRSELKQVRQIEVPAAQIFTKDEFYTNRLAAAQPGDRADKHVALAEELIKFRDYERALEHLQKAKDLGNSGDPARVERTLQRLQLYKESAKERELLDQIQAARSRNTLIDFEKGLKFVAQFEKDYPTSKLRGEFDVEKKRFTEGRTRFLAAQVADGFRRLIQIVADKKTGEDGVTLAAARDYAENKMSDELFQRVATQLRLDVAEVKQLWSERAKVTVGKRTELFSYGLGSWILGPQGVLKDTQVAKQAAQDAPKEDPNSRDAKRIAELMKAALERRRNQAQGNGGAADAQRELTDEEWWSQASRAERTSWLRAFYAEFGGQLVVASASVQPCITCYGEGTTPEMGPDGKMTRKKCVLCHATKWLRSVRAY